jgi:hypothetical protein
VAARKADSLTATFKPTVYKMWEHQRLIILWAFTICYRDSFTFTFLYKPLVLTCLKEWWRLHFKSCFNKNIFLDVFNANNYDHGDNDNDDHDNDNNNHYLIENNVFEKAIIACLVEKLHNVY